MTTIWLGLVGALKHILLKVLSEKFFIWLTMYGAQALADHTKTTFDDALVKQIKEALDGTDTKGNDQEIGSPSRGGS